MTLTYEGRDQGMIPRQGSVGTDDPDEVIRRFWPHGWKKLEVRNSDGFMVAAIGTLGKGGPRCWSVVKTTDPAPTPESERERRYEAGIPPVTKADAALFIVRASQTDLTTSTVLRHPETAARLYRVAVENLSPEPGGPVDRRLQEARQLLGIEGS